MSVTSISSHANTPIRIEGNPSLYTDVNGKEWIVIFDETDSYLCDLSNDKYQAFIDFHQKWTSVNDAKQYSIVSTSDDFCLYETWHVIDNNNHTIYICDGYAEGRIFVFDIKDLPNKKYRLLDVIDTSHMKNFYGGYQMFVIGHNLHFLFALKLFSDIDGYEPQHCKYNLKLKKFSVIDENFEQKYLDRLDFSVLTPKTKEEKRSFINNLKVRSRIDGMMLVDEWTEEFFPATIKHIVEAKDQNEWNRMHLDMNDILYIRLFAIPDAEQDIGRFAYVHFEGLLGQDKWMVLNKNRVCDCKNKCTNNEHKFSIPVTQSSFREYHKGTSVIYSKKHNRFIIVGREKGLLCYKNVNYQWCDYYDNIDFSINGKQSYYKGNKTKKSIEKHYFILIVNGYLQNSNYNCGINLPIDLYNIILKYYYQSGDDEWVFVKNDQIPLCCNCACVLVNDEQDIIIIGGDDTEIGSPYNIYKYNIDKNESIEIQGIEIVKRSDQIKGVYSKQTNRIYLFGRDQGTKVSSIDVLKLLQLSGDELN